VLEGDPGIGLPLQLMTQRKSVFETIEPDGAVYVTFVAPAIGDHVFIPAGELSHW
jgi:hypothetical protein